MGARQWLVEHLPSRGGIREDRKEMQELARTAREVAELAEHSPEEHVKYYQWVHWQGYKQLDPQAWRIWRELHGYTLDQGQRS
jgi:sugar phosphate isomerase/epimerase